MRQIFFFRLISIIIILVISQTINAQIPRTLSYQGLLTDSLGNPKADGLYTITFRLYDVNDGGSALWTESKSVQIKRGLFSTILGDQTVISTSVTFEKPYWLSIQVETESELSPRLPLTAVGYSLYSTKSDTSKFTLNNPSGWIHTANIVMLSDLSDKVGIGLTNPITKLEVNDLMRVSNIFSWPSSGRGLELAYNPGMRRGYIQVYDRDSAKWGELYLGDGKIGIGAFSSDKFTVNGSIRSISGGFVFPDGSTQTTAASTSSGVTLPYNGSATTIGNVFSIINLGTGKGIYGKHNTSNNFGYLGSSDYGVYGESSTDITGPKNPPGAGVYGKHTSAGNGVHGTSLNGQGVRGFSTNAYGVFGTCSDTGAAGVYGGKGSNYGLLGSDIDGVYGVSNSDNGSGVTGINDSNGSGIYGQNTASGQSGELGGSNFAVKANGDLFVSGAYRGDIGPNLGAPFPRPAWDSNWGSIDIAETKTFYHNIGGDVDNYVVELTFKDSGGKILGAVNYWDVIYKGARWFDLTSESIKVRRDLGDILIDKVRLRIWVYR